MLQVAFAAVLRLVLVYSLDVISKAGHSGPGPTMSGGFDLAGPDILGPGPECPAVVKRGARRRCPVVDRGRGLGRRFERLTGDGWSPPCVSAALVPEGSAAYELE